MKKANTTATAILCMIIAIVFFGLLVVMILCITGVIQGGNKSHKVSGLCCGSSKREIKSGGRSTEISFAAEQSPGGGKIQLSWKYDISGSGGRKAEDIKFPVKIWQSSTTPENVDTTPADKTITLVGSAASDGQENYTITKFTGNLYFYNALLDGPTYFVKGDNWVSISTEIESNEITLSSNFTSAQKVTVEPLITTAATFVSLFFNANSVTKIGLMWSHTLEEGTNPNQICYKIQSSALELTMLGFTKKTITNNVIVDPVSVKNILKVTFTSNLSPTKITSDCCCMTNGVTNSTVFQKGNIIYVYVVADTLPDADKTSSVSLTLTTYDETCLNSTGDSSTSTAYILADDLDVQFSISDANCKNDSDGIPSCTFVDSTLLESSTFDNITTCDAPFASNPGTADNGGAAVQMNVDMKNYPSDIISSMVYNWIVVESVIASATASNDVYTTTAAVNWSLPSGYYTPSCIIYASTMTNGNYIQVKSVSGKVFKVNLAAPENEQVSPIFITNIN